jgi:hypothetical protein
MRQPLLFVSVFRYNFGIIMNVVNNGLSVWVGLVKWKP